MTKILYVDHANIPLLRKQRDILQDNIIENSFKGIDVGYMQSLVKMLDALIHNLEDKQSMRIRS